MPEPVLLNPLNTKVVEEFAQNMSESIIQSFQNQTEEGGSEMPVSDQEQEMVAEELASTVIKIAVREACMAQSIKDRLQTDPRYAETVSFVDTLREENSLDKDMDEIKDIQTSYHPPLCQSGFPVVGSLDYPDAPPTTPLIPELERSRHSFARKLKGGLAKVFLPSPPPPTPKDKDDNSDCAIADPQVELMEHLMHSLSTRDVDPHYGASMEAFADALSWDIMDWVLDGKNREMVPFETDVHQLAQQLAETIISSSLNKAKMLL